MSENHDTREGHMEHVIQQYSLERGSLEIEYMEQYFEEFRERKTAVEIMQRLRGREHLILISMGPAPEDASHLVPVAFKVGHELRPREHEPQLQDLTERLQDCLDLRERRVFYSWIGGTRQQWRGQGHYRALTEQQEEWAHRNAYDELVVKTKNHFYGMRATLDHLHFDVLKFERNAVHNGDSKVYMHKRLNPDVIRRHLTLRMVVEAA
jgi:hypothetical protein